MLYTQYVYVQMFLNIIMPTLLDNPEIVQLKCACQQNDTGSPETCSRGIFYNDVIERFPRHIILRKKECAVKNVSATL